MNFKISAICLGFWF